MQRKRPRLEINDVIFEGPCPHCRDTVLFKIDRVVPYNHRPDGVHPPYEASNISGCPNCKVQVLSYKAYRLMDFYTKYGFKPLPNPILETAAASGVEELHSVIRTFTKLEMTDISAFFRMFKPITGA